MFGSTFATFDQSLVVSVQYFDQFVNRPLSTYPHGYACTATSAAIYILVVSFISLVLRSLSFIVAVVVVVVVHGAKISLFIEKDHGNSDDVDDVYVCICTAMSEALIIAFVAFFYIGFLFNKLLFNLIVWTVRFRFGCAVSFVIWCWRFSIPLYFLRYGRIPYSKRAPTNYPSIHPSRQPVSQRSSSHVKEKLDAKTSMKEENENTSRAWPTRVESSQHMLW